MYGLYYEGPTELCEFLLFGPRYTFGHDPNGPALTRYRLSPSTLLSQLTNRGVSFEFPADYHKKLEHWNSHRDEYGIFHPEYYLRDGIILARNPNILNFRLDWFRARIGLTALPQYVAKVDSILISRNRGELELASALASTDMPTGAWLLKQFGYDLTKDASNAAKQTLYQGMYGKAAPDEFEDDSFKRLKPGIHFPSWRKDMLKRWPGLDISRLSREDKVAQSRAIRTELTSINLEVAGEYEDLFHGTLVGILHDTLLIEADYRLEAPIRDLLLRLYKAKIPYDIRLGPRAKPTDAISRMGLIAEDV